MESLAVCLNACVNRNGACTGISHVLRRLHCASSVLCSPLPGVVLFVADGSHAERSATAINLPPRYFPVIKRQWREHWSRPSLVGPSHSTPSIQRRAAPACATPRSMITVYFRSGCQAPPRSGRCVLQETL